MIEAVLFDYGLVLSGPPVPSAWTRIQEITGFDEPLLQHAYWAPRHEYDRGTHTAQSYWLTVSPNLTPTQIAALIEADTDLWTAPNQPMIDWAARLQSAGTRTGILSNLGDAMTAGVLTRMPWLERFDHRIFSHTLKLAKPESEIYHHAIAGLATPPAHVLFVDDRPDNCDAAREAGLQVIQYLHHPTFEQEMESRGWGGLWRTGRDLPSQ